jgi:hypothetical protein
MEKPRAYTKQEVRLMLIDHFKELAKHWAISSIKEKKYTIQDRLDGLLHSILSTLDGESLELPAIDLVLSPHEDDKQFHIQEGENYFEPGMVINDDICLHEMLYITETSEPKI